MPEARIIDYCWLQGSQPMYWGSWCPWLYNRIKNNINELSRWNGWNNYNLDLYRAGGRIGSAKTTSNVYYDYWLKIDLGLESNKKYRQIKNLNLIYNGTNSNAINWSALVYKAQTDAIYSPINYPINNAEALMFNYELCSPGAYRTPQNYSTLIKDNKMLCAVDGKINDNGSISFDLSFDIVNNNQSIYYINIKNKKDNATYDSAGNDAKLWTIDNTNTIYTFANYTITYTGTRPDTAPVNKGMQESQYITIEFDAQKTSIHTVQQLEQIFSTKFLEGYQGLKLIDATTKKEISPGANIEVTKDLTIEIEQNSWNPIQYSLAIEFVEAFYTTDSKKAYDTANSSRMTQSLLISYGESADIRLSLEGLTNKQNYDFNEANSGINNFKSSGLIINNIYIDNNEKILTFNAQCTASPELTIYIWPQVCKITTPNSTQLYYLTDTNEKSLPTTWPYYVKVKEENGGKSKNLSLNLQINNNRKDFPTYYSINKIPSNWLPEFLITTEELIQQASLQRHFSTKIVRGWANEGSENIQNNLLVNHYISLPADAPTIVVYFNKNGVYFDDNYYALNPDHLNWIKIPQGQEQEIEYWSETKKNGTPHYRSGDYVGTHKITKLWSTTADGSDYKINILGNNEEENAL